MKKTMVIVGRCAIPPGTHVEYRGESYSVEGTGALLHHYVFTSDGEKHSVMASDVMDLEDYEKQYPELPEKKPYPDCGVCESNGQTTKAEFIARCQSGSDIIAELPICGRFHSDQKILDVMGLGDIVSYWMYRDWLSPRQYE